MGLDTANKETIPQMKLSPENMSCTNFDNVHLEWEIERVDVSYTEA